MNVIGVMADLLATAASWGCSVLCLLLVLSECRAGLHSENRAVNHHSFSLHYLSLQFDETSLCSPCVLNHVLFRKNCAAEFMSADPTAKLINRKCVLLWFR